MKQASAKKTTAKKSAAKKTGWKLERASVHHAAKPRAKSNKYAKSDTTKRPTAGSRGRVWVGGYTRSDGTRVEGHYRVTR